MRIYKIASKIVFHASNDLFDRFDSKKQISGYYPGFYVSEDIEFVKSFGKIINQFILKRDNFFDMDLESSESIKNEAREAGYDVRNASGWGESKYLLDKGYDGIRRGKELIVFNPEKSLEKI
jgi:hypothetical protein